MIAWRLDCVKQRLGKKPWVPCKRARKCFFKQLHNILNNNDIYIFRISRFSRKAHLHTHTFDVFCVGYIRLFASVFRQERKKGTRETATKQFVRIYIGYYLFIWEWGEWKNIHWKLWERESEGARAYVRVYFNNTKIAFNSDFFLMFLVTKVFREYTERRKQKHGEWIEN